MPLVITWRLMSVSLVLFLHIVFSDELGTPEPRNIKTLTSSKADFLKHPCCNSWVKPTSEKSQSLVAALCFTISYSGSFGWSSCYSKWYSVKLIGWLLWFKRVTNSCCLLSYKWFSEKWCDSSSSSLHQQQAEFEGITWNANPLTGEVAVSHADCCCHVVACNVWLGFL